MEPSLEGKDSDESRLAVRSRWVRLRRRLGLVLLIEGVAIGDEEGEFVVSSRGGLVETAAMSRNGLAMLKINCIYSIKRMRKVCET